MATNTLLEEMQASSEASQSVSTVFPLAIKVSRSVIPCPVGGAGGFWPWSRIYVPDTGGEIETI